MHTTDIVQTPADFVRNDQGTFVQVPQSAPAAAVAALTSGTIRLPLVGTVDKKLALFAALGLGFGAWWFFVRKPKKGPAKGNGRR